MQTLLLLTLLSLIFSPQWDTDPDLWGVGIMVPGTEIAQAASEHLFQIPLGIGIPYYGTPEGEVQGFLLQRRKDDFSTALYPVGATPVQTRNVDFREIGYEVKSLIVFDQQDNWVRVLQHSREQAVWMSLADLAEIGYVFQPWMDFMLQSDNTFHPHEEYGMNLRGGPGTHHEKLASIKGDRYNITLTGKTDENWAEVKVIENTVHPCEDGVPTGREWIGWLKLIDDRGFPNLWFYTRGC